MGTTTHGGSGTQAIFGDYQLEFLRCVWVGSKLQHKSNEAAFDLGFPFEIEIHRPQLWARNPPT